MPLIVCKLLWRPDWPPTSRVDPFEAFFFRYSIVSIFFSILLEIEIQWLPFQQNTVCYWFSFVIGCYGTKAPVIYPLKFIWSIICWLLLQVPFNHTKQQCLLKVCSTHTSRMPNKLIYRVQVNKQTHAYTCTHGSSLLKHIYGFISNDPSDWADGYLLVCKQRFIFIKLIHGE